MKHLLAAAMVFIAIGALYAVPARPLYVPPEQPKPPPPFVFAGTHWVGKCYADNFWIIFEKNGSLTYGYSGNTFKNGTWNLQGNALYFEMNNKYLEFRGVMNGDVIQGESWNVAGSRWATYFSRMEKK
jgi:hypothetical protein